VGRLDDKERREGNYKKGKFYDLPEGVHSRLSSMENAV
jgi:hypothetical protein